MNFLFQGYTVVNLVIVAIVPVVMLYYLVTPEAKKAFGQTTESVRSGQ